ncbi:ABC transporter substrate-binding protein [Bacillus sp. SD088]|uniref:ABC transporter substrate-binding protein n=1 Tax=Bacillus sp. SD088 TaxID=2782012 RepID=UPI001A9757A8|nr:ABC transporter substrate-binding protein [Bacillus sp. SD088]MBO0993144.1 carbohydrate ABC transporter substrate-binding protein [Bacillus sp. SD088]
MKKLFMIVAVVSMIALLGACSGKKADLTITSFTDELQDVIDVFEEKYDVTVDLQIIPTENYTTTLRPSLESGKGAPDIFTGEIVYLKDWVEQDYWETLSQDPYDVQDWESDYMDYVFDLGKNEDGEVKAVSWQTTPGGIYYRRSIAKEVLGTDDPEEIGKRFSTMEGLTEVAEEMKANNYRLFPDEGSIQPYTDGQDPQPWVNENNELVMTDARLSYFDYAKEFRDKKYTALAPAWSPAWYESFNGPISYNKGWDEIEEDEKDSDKTEVFAVSLPTWGLHSVLKEHATETAGDWAVTNGPTPYFQGGTWIGMYKDSDNKDLAFKFIEMLVHDEAFLEDWVKETGDVLSYLPVTEKVKGDFSDEFLAGQNNYEFFLDEAEKIDASIITKYDQSIGDLFGTEVGNYVEGKTTKEDAIKEFYKQVKNAYPDIKVPDEK